MLNKTKIKEAIAFHGHLGPYLILGLLAGEYALKKLGCRKHFGIEVEARGADKKPKSCLIDGLQLSTGATFGKGNIRKVKARGITVLFSSRESKKKIILSLKKELINRLKGLKGHHDSEACALELSKRKPAELFNLQLL